MTSLKQCSKIPAGIRAAMDGHVEGKVPSIASCQRDYVAKVAAKFKVVFPQI